MPCNAALLFYFSCHILNSKKNSAATGQNHKEQKPVLIRHKIRVTPGVIGWLSAEETGVHS